LAATPCEQATWGTVLGSLTEAHAVIPRSGWPDLNRMPDDSGLWARLVDGVGWSTVEFLRLDRFVGSRLPMRTPRRRTGPDRRGLNRAPRQTVWFVLTGETDHDALPVLRLEGSGSPPIRYTAAPDEDAGLK
jgi:hypothetical protein